MSAPPILVDKPGQIPENQSIHEAVLPNTVAEPVPVTARSDRFGSSIVNS